MQPHEKGSLPLSIHGVRKGKSFPEQLRVSSLWKSWKKVFLTASSTHRYTYKPFRHISEASLTDQSVNILLYQVHPLEKACF